MVQLTIDDGGGMRAPARRGREALDITQVAAPLMGDAVRLRAPLTGGVTGVYGKARGRGDGMAGMASRLQRRSTSRVALSMGAWQPSIMDLRKSSESSRRSARVHRAIPHTSRRVRGIRVQC